MKDVITCPRCGRKLELPDEHVGKPVQCPSCNETFEGRPPAAAPTSARPPSVPSMPPLPRGPELGKWGEAPAAGSGRIAVAAHRGAMILTFGILALIPCILTSLLFGALAWTMGEADLREMRAGAMNSEGEGLTAAGRTMGIVGLVLWSMVHFFWCGAAIR